MAVGEVLAGSGVEEVHTGGVEPEVDVAALGQPTLGVEGDHAGSSTASSSVLLLSLAIAFAQAEQLDQAVAMATEALSIAGDQPIRRVRQRAEDLRRMLGPTARSSAVRDFDEQLHEFDSTLERAIAGPAA